jgi:Rab proteins geranylgeranyltransferase component A
MTDLRGIGVLYFSTTATASSKQLLEQALAEILIATVPASPPQALYQLYYEQAQGSVKTHVSGRTFELPAPSVAMSFHDDTLERVREASTFVMRDRDAALDEVYMVFPDREGVGDDDDTYD